MKTATKVQSEITANAIYKVTVKETGKVCYAVPSDSTPGAYYITCFDEKSSNWTCTCKNGKFCASRGQSSNCKHARAAQISILANKAQEKQARYEAAKASGEEIVEYNTMHQDGKQYGHFPIERINGGDWQICRGENGKPVQGFFTARQAEEYIRKLQQPVRLTREAYVEEFSPNYVAGMY